MNSVALSLKPIPIIQQALQETLAVYVPLIVLAIPGLVLSLLGNLVPFFTFVVGLANFVVVAPLMGGAMILVAYRHLNRESVSLEDCLSQSLKKALPLILGFLLLFVCLLGGFIALIIPGIYLSIRLGFTLYAIVIDSQSATGGLGYSWQLVKGHWWKIFIPSFLLGLMVFVLFLIISPFIGGSFVVSVGTSPTEAPSLLALFVSNIVSTAVMPFFIMLGTLLFLNLRVLKAPTAKPIEL